MFCRGSFFNKIPVIKLAVKYDQKLIWVAIGYPEWKTNLILNKHASGNNSCNHTHIDEKYIYLSTPSKRLKLETFEKNIHEQAILEEQESIQIIVNIVFDKINLLRDNLNPK